MSDQSGKLSPAQEKIRQSIKHLTDEEGRVFNKAMSKRTIKGSWRSADQAKKIAQRVSINASTWNTYKSMAYSLTEARRMTRKELQDVATEVHGTSDKPSKIPAGKGYTPKRTKRETRRAEKRGATPMSQGKIKGMSSADLAQNIKPGIGGTAKLMGRALLQWKKRRHLQNIPKMIKTMKRDPGEFPAAVSFSRDERTKGKPGHVTKARPTAVTGRTRMAAATVAGAEPHGITIPAEKYAGRAEEHDKWVKSGGKAKKEKELKAKGQRLGGQDPRQLTAWNTYKNIGSILYELSISNHKFSNSEAK